MGAFHSCFPGLCFTGGVKIAASCWSQFSPLARTPLPAEPKPEEENPHRDLPPGTADGEGKAESSAPKRTSGKWRRRLLGGALSLSVLASAGALTGPGQALVQQLFQPQAAAQSLVDQLQGYAGESAIQRQTVIEELSQNLPLLDAPEGHPTDQKFGLSDLRRVAQDRGAPVPAQEGAQALLADPLLLRSLDVANGGKVDSLISQADLNTALGEEAGGDFGTFREVRDRLVQGGESSVFQYLDHLGADDQGFSWGDLSQVETRGDAPEPVRTLAQELQANRNYFNAFDVATAANSVPFWQSGESADGFVSAEDLEQIAYAPQPEAGRQFSEQDQIALDQILSGQVGLESDVIPSFRQTDRGNCATTAVIKAGLQAHGADLFGKVEKLPQGAYSVTMRDGFHLTISPGELEAAATAEHYAGESNPTRSLATLAFASMAKRAWAMGHEGAGTYGQALLSLNDGEFPEKVPTYLGLEHEFERIAPDQVSQGPAAVVWGNGHAYYVETEAGQSTGDKWGTPTAWKGLTFVDTGKPQNQAMRIKS